MRRSLVQSVLTMLLLWPLSASDGAADKPAPNDSGVTIEYIGHTSFLITDHQGIRIVTDPYLGRPDRPFPEVLSVDLVAISSRGPDHDAAFQLRGNPVMLGAEGASGNAGDFQVQGFPMPPGDGHESDARRGFIIRHEGLKIAFLGQVSSALSAETLGIIEGSDAVLAGLDPGPKLQVLAGWQDAHTLVPVWPENSAGGKLQEPSGGMASPIPGWKHRAAATLQVVPNMPREVVMLDRKTGSVGPARPTYSVFADTLIGMTWPQVKQAASEGALVLVPVGVIEEHGPHMGLGADTYLTCTRVRKIKESLSALGVKAVVAPPYFWGITDDTADFPGSFNVRPETMAALISDICRSLHSWGFRRLIFVNEHGNRNHRRILADTLAQVRNDLDVQAFALDSILSSAPLYRPAPRAGGYAPDYHAGAVETRLMADAFAAEVDLRLAGRLKPEPSFKPLGYAGDPASYSKEDGYDGYYSKAADYDARRIMAHLAPAGEVREGKGEPPDSVDQQARAVIDRYVLALGGRDRLLAVRTQSRAGELRESERSVPFHATVAAGEKWSIILQPSESEIQRFGFDGSIGWMTERGEVRQLPEAQVLLFTAVLDPHLALRLTQLFTRIAVSAEKAPDDGPTCLLKAETRSGAEWTLVFDTKTGLLQRLGDIRFGDYREVDGVMVPFSVILRDGQLPVSFGRVENNVPVKDSDFSLPPERKVPEK